MQIKFANCVKKILKVGRKNSQSARLSHFRSKITTLFDMTNFFSKFEKRHGVSSRDLYKKWRENLYKLVRMWLMMRKLCNSLSIYVKGKETSW